MKASEILDKAADEMMIRGKCEGSLIEDDGFYKYVEGGRVCSMGAIALANGSTEEELFYDEDDSLFPGAREYGDYLYLTGKTGYVSPMMAILDHNDQLGPDGMLSTAEEIVDLMRSCAKTLREKNL